MKLFQIINICRNKLRDVVPRVRQTDSEEKNNGKRVCVKFCLQSESEDVVNDLLSYGAYVVDYLKRIGIDACLEEEAHQDYLACRSGALSFMHVDSQSYRTYLQERFACMLVIMVYGTTFENNEAWLLYYRMQNISRPFADQHVRNIGLNIKPIINIIEREKTMFKSA